MDDKIQRLTKMLESCYGLSSPKLSLHEIFSDADFKTYTVSDNQNSLYKLVEYDKGNFNDNDNLVRYMKDGEEVLWIKDYELIEPLENQPCYTLYRITLEEGQEI